MGDSWLSEGFHACSLETDFLVRRRCIPSDRNDYAVGWRCILRRSYPPDQSYVQVWIICWCAIVDTQTRGCPGIFRSWEASHLHCSVTTFWNNYESFGNQVLEDKMPEPAVRLSSWWISQSLFGCWSSCETLTSVQVTRVILVCLRYTNSEQEMMSVIRNIKNPAASERRG